MRLLHASNTLFRPLNPSLCHAGETTRADATATCTSSAPKIGYVPTTSPVTGKWESKVAP